MRLSAFISPSGILRLAQILCLSLFFGLTASASGSSRTVVPFEIDEHQRLIIDMTFEGELTTSGVIDTAATFPMIGGATARAAGIEVPDADTGRFITVLGLGGPEVFQLIDVPQVTAGGVAFTQMPAALDEKIAVKGVKNIFPAVALQGDVLDFDFERKILSAYSARPDGNNRSLLARMPLHVRNGLFFVEVKIHGVKGLALIDTGSTITYVNSRFAEDANMNTNTKKTELLLGVTGEDYDIRMARVRHLSVGRLNLEGMDLLVSDPHLFEYLGISDEPVMVLGMDFLSHFRVQIDRKNNQLYLRRRGDSRKKDCISCRNIDHFTRR